MIDNIFNWNFTTERVQCAKKELNSSDYKKKLAYSEYQNEFIHLINNSYGRESIVNALKRGILNTQALLHILSARSEHFKRVALSTRKELEIISNSESSEKTSKTRKSANQENLLKEMLFDSIQSVS
ncbi:MAG: hypothetical protein EZS28_046921, partial [Streblomastix strix]